MKQNQDVKNKAGKIAVVLLVGVAALTGFILTYSNAKAQNGATTTTASQKVAQASTTPVEPAPAPVAAATTPAVAPAPEPVKTEPAPVSAPAETATATSTASSTESSQAANAAPLNLPPASSAQPVDTAPAVGSANPSNGNGYGNNASARAEGGAQSDVGGVGVPDYYPEGQTAVDEQARLPVLFSLDFQTIYDDNIYISRNDRKADVIYRTTPKITFESTRLEKWERRNTASKRGTTKVGADESQSAADEEETQPDNYFRTSYAATWQKYNKYATNDSLDHNAQVFYRHKSEKSLFEAGQTFTTFNGPNLDVQGSLQQTNYGTRLFGTYAVTGKSNVELEAVQSFNRYDVGFNNNEWTLSPYYNYEIASKTTLGIGTIVDFLNVTGGINQTSVQPNLRLIYKYSEKLMFTSRFGVEVREFSGYDYERVSPMFALGSQWNPFEHTTIKIDGYRRTAPAISSNGQDYDATGAIFSIRQDFLKKYYASMRATYEYSDYFFGSNGTSAGRSQDYYTFRPTLGYLPNDMLSFNIYYQFSQNVASQASNCFRDNQVGFQGSFSY